MKRSTSLVIIDGSNFYFKLKSLGLSNLLAFNFTKYLNLIARKSKIIRSTYYIGAVKAGRTKKSGQLHASQQKLFSHLKKHKIHYFLGYLLKSGGSFHEKGVDVAMAVDMLITAYENRADRIILVSSDTDLLPAIKKVRALGKTVEYVGFSHEPSIALVANASESRLLTREDLAPFCSKNK